MKLWEDPRLMRGMKAQLQLRRRRLGAGDLPLGWKVGIAAPAMAKLCDSRSTALPRRTAAMTPSGTPTMIAMHMLSRTSSMVAGRYRVISSSTGRCERLAVPQSPRTSPERYIRYCSGSGPSSTMRRRIS